MNKQLIKPSIVLCLRKNINKSQQNKNKHRVWEYIGWNIVAIFIFLLLLKYCSNQFLTIIIEENRKKENLLQQDLRFHRSSPIKKYHPIPPNRNWSTYHRDLFRYFQALQVAWNSEGWWRFHLLEFVAWFYMVLNIIWTKDGMVNTSKNRYVYINGEWVWVIIFCCFHEKTTI
jgi:hypothetical protein